MPAGEDKGNITPAEDQSRPEHPFEGWTRTRSNGQEERFDKLTRSMATSRPSLWQGLTASFRASSAEENHAAHENGSNKDTFSAEESNVAGAEERSFDGLTRALASGDVSRGRALRVMSSALVGGLLASIPGVALADHKPGHGSGGGGGGGGGGTGPKCKPLDGKCATNQDCCSRYCDKNGRICACPPEETLCNRQCVDCSNIGEIVNPTTCKCECPANIPEVCGNRCLATCTPPKTQRNPNSCACECPNICTAPKTVQNPTTCECTCPACTSPKVPNPTTCACECPNTCTAPKTVQNPNTCECSCPTGTQTCGTDSCCIEGVEECCQGQCHAVCAPGEVRNTQTCACEAVACSGSPQACTNQFLCDPNPLCYCLNTTEGTHACIYAANNVCSGLFCASTSDCPPDFLCTLSCCGQQCFPPCGSGAAAPLGAQALGAQTEGGPSPALPS